MKGCGQFCPIAQAAQILTERWTPLVLRELICGSTRFDDLRRGVPLMSSSQLSQRLRSLEEAGVIERRPAPSGHGFEYHLTDAGRELEPLIMMMGEWGAHWARNRLGPEDRGVTLLMWDMHARSGPSTSRGRRVVVALEFTDVPQNKRRWWLVSEGNAADLCMTDPGHEVDLFVFVDLPTMTAIWIGDLSVKAALASGALEAHGPAALRRRLHAWLGLSQGASRRALARPLRAEDAGSHAGERRQASRSCWPAAQGGGRARIPPKGWRAFRAQSQARPLAGVDQGSGRRQGGSDRARRHGRG